MTKILFSALALSACTGSELAPMEQQLGSGGTAQASNAATLNGAGGASGANGSAREASDPQGGHSAATVLGIGGSVGLGGEPASGGSAVAYGGSKAKHTTTVLGASGSSATAGSAWVTSSGGAIALDPDPFKCHAFETRLEASQTGCRYVVLRDLGPCDTLVDPGGPMRCQPSVAAQVGSTSNCTVVNWEITGSTSAETAKYYIHTCRPCAESGVCTK